MPSQWPTYNALKVTALFVQSTARKYCCYDLSKHLDLAPQTTFDTLKRLLAHGWLEAEKEKINRTLSGKEKPRRVLYRITPTGLDESLVHLANVQVRGRDMDLLLIQPLST